MDRARRAQTTDQPSGITSPQYPESFYEISRLNKQLQGLYQQGKYAKAEPIMRHYLRVLEDSGADPTTVSQTYLSYAKLLETLGKIDRAKIARAAVRQTGSPKFGIIGVRFSRHPNSSLPVVDKVFAGGPAAKAGFKENDALIAIDGISIPSDWLFAEVAGSICGRSGSEARFKVLRNNKVISLKCVRASIDSLDNPQLRDQYLKQR